MLLTAAACCVPLTVSADYEYGAAACKTVWDEDRQLFSCNLMPGADFPDMIRIGDNSFYANFFLEGRAAQTKTLRVVVMDFADILTRFCRDLGDGEVSLPIMVKMQNGNKLTGSCLCSSRIIRPVEEGVKHNFTVLYLNLRFSDLHCKKEPEAGTAAHEGFIGMKLIESNIKEIEIADGAVKLRMAPFSTRASLTRMLRCIADCTDEMDLYFPSSNEGHVSDTNSPAGAGDVFGKLFGR